MKTMLHNTLYSARTIESVARLADELFAQAAGFSRKGFSYSKLTVEVR